MEKDKKKTLTISSNFKKTIDTSALTTGGKKSFEVKKKKFFKEDKLSNKFTNKNINQKPQSNLKKKNFARKFVEQQATKDFIKKENKPTGKSKLKLKNPVDKRDFKLTVSRALNVEEIEIKQRSLASVKRARLKEKKNKPEGEEKKEFKKVIRDVKIPEQITIQELSNRMAEKSSDIIKFLFNMKVIATINHNIDKDTAEYIVKEFGHKPILEDQPSLQTSKVKEKLKGDEQIRPPVVTIMGHVDHGKTSLLDSLRDTNVVSGEFGGITQHIGAYQVKTEENKMITFIDTPGHAAFTEMRARGSKITDIVVLVVAADDGIKPQTIEAIKHAKAAKVPIIVAINKCDLPEKNISKIKNEMMQYELIAEDLSGETLFVEVSALKKINLDKLKESILLQSEILDLKASFSGQAKGVVIESKIDKGKGPVSTILISSGKLKRGDFFICGDTWGKIRAMINYEGKNIDEALPSMPVEILGMNSSAFAGAEFLVTKDEDEAKEMVAFKKNNSTQSKLLAKDKTTLFDNTKQKDELNIIIKSDVQGSNEALKMAINKIKHEEVEAKIILSDIGMINETDVSLAKASNAILIGFNVKPNREAKKLATEQKIDIKYFNIIYEAIEYVEKSLSGLLEPDVKETVIGSAEIQKIFKVSKAGKIAGSKVINGEIKSKSKARIIRDGVVVYSGEIQSIFREKNQVKEVGAGLECGISLKDFIDFKEKDVIESYLAEKIERTI
ncbi:MAG: translation initiation factor IF-2 [Candidatus Pelagibacter sp. TMED128]|nr:MAG: translation initiation factor IF-2 [Candidatus Pelagibacter sp. TMED128]|tara:strand:- start:273 stop:2459 length:2187 start_codon:yes stop_codon:yes gene_type:complete